MSKYYAIKDSKVKHSEYDRINEDLYLKIDNFCSLVNESALSNYKKIYIVTALRTTYGNKVLLYPDGKPYKVTDLQFPDNSVAKLYDLCLLSSKYAFTSAIGEENLKGEVVANSGCYPIGAMKYEDSYYILSHVVLDDSVLDLPYFKLQDGHSFTTIPEVVSENAFDKCINERLKLISKEDLK